MVAEDNGVGVQIACGACICMHDLAKSHNGHVQPSLSSTRFSRRANLRVVVYCVHAPSLNATLDGAARGCASNRKLLANFVSILLSLNLKLLKRINRFTFIKVDDETTRPLAGKRQSRPPLRPAVM